MFSRRGFLTGTLAAGIARSMRLNASPAGSRSLTSPRFEVPDQACDCHVHVIGDPTRFPFAASRTYTPEPASVEELHALHRALHLRRVVVVQPSVYGTDNACTLDAMRHYGPTARGIAVLPPATPSATLDDLARAGMRGVRVNVGTSPDTNIAEARRRLTAAIELVQGRNWHVQVYAPLPVVAAVSDLVQSSPVPVVFDHFGGAKAAAGLQQPGFDKLLQLVANGKAYVKISGVYRASTSAPSGPQAGPDLSAPAPR
jgi:predicted TIM-barrel fold metal-dependent hydrolase